MAGVAAKSSSMTILLGPKMNHLSDLKSAALHSSGRTQLGKEAFSIRSALKHELLFVKYLRVL